MSVRSKDPSPERDQDLVEAREQQRIIFLGARSLERGHGSFTPHDEERLVIDDEIVSRNLRVERLTLTQAEGGVRAGELDRPLGVIARKDGAPAVLGDN